VRDEAVLVAMGISLEGERLVLGVQYPSSEHETRLESLSKRFMQSRHA